MNNPDALPDLKPDNKNGFTVPPPPAPDMGVRTMSSDASSLRTPGGASTQPKAFNPKDLLGSEPVFNPDSTTIINQGLPPEPPHSNKKLIIGLGVGVFLILAGIVGYFIIWPLVSKTFFPAPAPEPVPVPVVVIPQPVPPPVEPAPAPVPPAFQHASLFPQASAVSSVNIQLASVNNDLVNNALKQSFGPSVAVPAFNEVAFFLTTTGAVDAYQFLGNLVPSVSANITSVITQDFTGFVYKDKDGIWPGYVFALQNADATAEPNLSFMNNVQLSAKTFYVSDPGAEKSDYKVGAKPSANYVWVKYKPYTIAGASFNIGQVAINGKNYLILSTSYQGFQMASQKLGF